LPPVFNEQTVDLSTLINPSPVPIYYQLQTIIQKQIEDGHLKPGDAVLPERKMAELYKVSVGTVRQAVASLVNEGFLIRRSGVGTFVAGTVINPDSVRYYRYLEDFGGPEAALTFTFESIRKVAAYSRINIYLKIGVSQDLFELKRLMFIAGEPMVYSISYLPQRMFKGLDEVPASRFEKVALYKLIEQSYSLPTVSNQELLSVVPAEKEAADALKIQPGAPVLLIEMLAYTYKNKAYEFRKSFCMTNNRKVLHEL
jgi:GntR family transcriptional regulator